MNDNRIALSEYRLDEAARCIRAAKISVDNDDYKNYPIQPGMSVVPRVRVK